MPTVGSSTWTPELVRHWSLQADPLAASRTRAEVLQQCADWRVEPRAAADVTLVAAELLANAVKHGSGPLLLTLRAGTTHIYVGVVDRTPDVSATVVPPPELVSESGRGLTLVDALSTTWGTEQQAASSKLVWATIPSGSP